VRARESDERGCQSHAPAPHVTFVTCRVAVQIQIPRIPSHAAAQHRRRGDVQGQSSAR
jgi:hypothetical protein